MHSYGKLEEATGDGKYLRTVAWLTAIIKYL